MKTLPVLFVLLTLALASPALGQQGPSGQVEVSADSFVIDEVTRSATFSGNVVVAQQGLEMRAAMVVVRYGEGGPSDIDSLEATGGVRLVTPGQAASGDRGVYDPGARILRLVGNVVVSSPQGELRGPELVVNLADRTSQFTGGAGGRVTGVFTP